MSSGVTCHHRLWTTHTVGLHLAWHDITAFGHHTLLNNVGRGMPSSPLGNTHAHGRQTRSNDVGRDMPSPPLKSTHSPTTSEHTVSNIGRGMTSPPLDSTHGRQQRALHEITALGQYTRSDDVGTGITSPPLGSTHAHTVELHQAWHAIIALGRQTRTNDHTQSDEVGRGMTSPPLDNTHDRQCRAWHDITAFGQHTQSDDVGRGMLSPPLDGTHGRMTLGHARSNDVGHGMTSPPLDNTYFCPTLGVACHHRLWAAQTVKRRWSWHDITSFRQHTRSNDHAWLDDVGRGMTSPSLDSKHAHTTGNVGCGMTSPPLDSTHGRQCRAWDDITAIGSTHSRTTPGVAWHHRL
uniref:Uncharacterized protein n=1 Tax=Solanum lycopersicum TaxID=4081 RepID=A0A3Q7HMF4_SOLLC